MRSTNKTFDASAGRFRDSTSGRFVTRDIKPETERKTASTPTGKGRIPSAAKSLYELGREMLGIKPRPGKKRP